MAVKLIGLIATIICMVQAFPPFQLNLEEEIRHYPNQYIKFSRGLTRERLPHSIIPIHYSISLIPIIDHEDVDFKKAPGEVTMRIKCLEGTNSIIIHSSEIIIEEITVTSEAGETIQVADFVLDNSKETLEIKLETSLLPENEYDVDIVFESRVADNRLNGLYLSQYVDPETGVTNYHAATQLEDIAARKVFPCMDEPGLKATFEMRLGRKDGFHSLWNMPMNRSEPMESRPGYFWDIYPKIPVKMSTYLMAIVVSDFEEEIAPEGLYSKPVKIFGPKSMMQSSDHGEFAAQTAAKVLNFFETYLDYGFDLPKMDSVAVPQFAAGSHPKPKTKNIQPRPATCYTPSQFQFVEWNGYRLPSTILQFGVDKAMENWGLNLYRTQYLLFTPEESTQANKWSMASVLAHELAHQWFGNLVTMDWWNGIYLNEGFSNYMQFHGSNGAAPQFTPLLRVNTDTLQNALNFDAGPQSTQVYMTELNEVVNAPSAIIYDKGASIIRMMQGFLTEGTLIRGLRKYLKNKAYDNVVQDDVFEVLTEQGHSDGTLGPNLTVKEIMDTWTLQAGYPLIRVSRAGSSRIYISQRKFLNDPKAIPDDSTWYVPIPWITKANPVITDESLQPKAMIPPDVALISAELNTTNEWILINPDGKGFYRVLYDDHLTSLLSAQLNEDHNVLSILSRGQLIDDYFKIALSEKVSIKSALGFTPYLNKERELAVWIPAINNLRTVITKMRDNSDGMKLMEYLLPKFEEPLENISWLPTVEEEPNWTILRSHLVDVACTIGSMKCYENSLEQMQNWITEDQNGGANPIWPDFQASVYCSGVWQGGDPIWDFVFKKYSEEKVTDRHRTLLLNALACYSDAEKLTELLTRVIGSEESSGIRNNDAVNLLQRIAENSAGREAAFMFIQSRPLVIIGSRVGEGGIKSIVTGLSTYFNTAERMEEMARYLEDNQSLFSEDLINHINGSFTSIQTNINFVSSHGADIAEFLSNP